MTRRRALRGRAGSGQSLVEFALVLLPVFVVVMGIIDFGYIYLARLNESSSVRNALRFAVVNTYASNPNLWSSADPAASGSIEAVIQGIAVGHIPNHLTSETTPTTPGIGLEYYTIAGTPAKLHECGYYDPASGFVGLTVGGTTYTASTCVVSGNVVTIRATMQVLSLTTVLNQRAYVIQATSSAVIE